MAYQIRKAAVIGSGTMGGGIAALLTGVGIPVVLLDIPSPDSAPGDSPSKRNTIVNNNLKTLQKSRPAQFFQDKDVDLITIGNTADDLDKLADVDWIIEVIIEKLPIKQELMARLDEIRKPGAIISTNTSGLSIEAIAEGRSDDFRRHFLGTHFFNPPRYLKLLEIIPHPDTDPFLLDFMVDFGTSSLGKGCVICKDTPNFIANRFISIIGGFTANYALDNGYTIEEVDALTGPLIGHPKTATFQLQDLVGIDVMVYVGRNLYEAIPDDPWRDVLQHADTERVLNWLMEKKFLGRKSKQGFYKTVTDESGNRVHLPLNLQTLEYEQPTKVRFDSVGKHRKVENTGERIKAMINEDDRGGQFVWHIHAALFAYASEKLGEIADTIVDIDNANRWGFNHELGPFQIWDAVGVAETLPRLEADGYKVAPWVQEMVESGHTTFYQRNAQGVVVGYYDPARKEYQPLKLNKDFIVIENLRAEGKTVDRLPGASLLDIGDGVALLEFHSKANSIDEDIVKMAHKALDRLQTDFDGLVIGNQGENFSVGANIFMILMIARNADWQQLDAVVKAGQDLTQALRYASKPIVTAPFGMVLGGGAELTMSGTRSVAHAETYIGLVEFGVGVIPAWGGSKEMLRRNVNPVMESSPIADPLPHVQKVFEQIAMAKVAESAKQGKQMGFFTDADRIITNRDQLLAEAKREVLHLIPNYQPRTVGKIYAAGRDVYAALQTGAWMLGEGNYATEYEVYMAQRLAYVLTGGVTVPQWVDEQVILDLEREVFIELCHQEKTQARLQHMLENNKPLRN